MLANTHQLLLTENQVAHSPDDYNSVPVRSAKNEPIWNFVLVQRGEQYIPQENQRHPSRLFKECRGVRCEVHEDAKAQTAMSY